MSDTLPPLPDLKRYIALDSTDIYTITPVYTADQMRAYAAQAVAERDAEIERLRAENKALKADAERYRWLRDNCVGTVAPEGIVTTHMELGFTWYSPSWKNGERQDSVSLDAAIDRARSKE